MILNILIFVYLFIGIIYTYFDWVINYQQQYNMYKENNIKTHDSELITYWCICIVAWPLIIFIKKI